MAMVGDGQGRYRFIDLPRGTYQLRFELQGFDPLVRQNLEVNAGFAARVDATPKVGSLQATATVSGAGPGGGRTTTGGGPGAVAEPATPGLGKPQLLIGAPPSIEGVPAIAYRSQLSVVPLTAQPWGASFPAATAGTTTEGCEAAAVAACALPGLASTMIETTMLAVARSARPRRAYERGADVSAGSMSVIASPQFAGQPVGGSMRKTVIIPPKVAP